MSKPAKPQSVLIKPKGKKPPPPPKAPVVKPKKITKEDLEKPHTDRKLRAGLRKEKLVLQQKENAKKVPVGKGRESRHLNTLKYRERLKAEGKIPPPKKPAPSTAWKKGECGRKTYLPKLAGEVRPTIRAYADQLLHLDPEALVENKPVTVAQAIVRAQYIKALKGDTRAFGTMRDTVGEMPTQRIGGPNDEPIQGVNVTFHSRRGPSNANTDPSTD